MLLRSDVMVALAVSAGVGLAVQSGVNESVDARTDVVESHQAVSFATDVLPLFEKHCTECHGEESAELGLLLDTYEGVMAGSDYGTVVEPGDPDGSLLVDMIASGDMPEDNDPVPADELEVIKTWIAEGAEKN